MLKTSGRIDAELNVSLIPEKSAVLELDGGWRGMLYKQELRQQENASETVRVP
jgi:hypothetical protein